MLRKELDALTPETVSELGGHLSKKNNSLVVAYIHRIIEMKDSPAHVQRLLADFEIAADKDLAISKTLTKNGTDVGINGNADSNGSGTCRAFHRRHCLDGLQYAGGICHYGCRAVLQCYRVYTQQVKQRWYLQDMTNLEFLSELLNQNQKE